MERDPEEDITVIGKVISTHTLTWSVTCNSGTYSFQQNDFNSHAHVERDAPHRLSERKRLNFNSHAHVERD